MLAAMLVKSSSASIAYRKSQISDLLPIIAEYVPVTQNPSGENMRIEIYFWICPIVSNTISTEMQLMRVSLDDLFSFSNDYSSIIMITLSKTKSALSFLSSLVIRAKIF